MVHKHYFIVALGQVGGIKDDLLEIATNQPKYIDSKNVLLCSFTSSLNIDEMNDMIQVKKDRVYFINEVNETTFTYFVPNPDHQEVLFGDYIKSNMVDEEIEHEIVDENVEKTTMSIFDLIDKGYENLTDEEKEFLNKNS